MNPDSAQGLFIQNVLKELPNLPSDAYFSFLLSHENDIQDLYDGKKGPYCSNCFCTWSIGCRRMRLWPPPRKASAIRSMTKRAERKRISRKEKTLLSLAENHQNALVMKCKVCDYEMVNKFDLPKKVFSTKAKKEQEKKDIIKTKKKKKKKKKKKQKEQNAGLSIPCEMVTHESKPRGNCDQKNKAHKEPEIVNDKQIILDGNHNVNKPTVKSKSSAIRYRPKLKRLNLSVCTRNKRIIFNPKPSQKPTSGATRKALNLQNMALRQARSNKQSLTLDSFLGSLI